MRGRLAPQHSRGSGRPFVQGGVRGAGWLVGRSAAARTYMIMLLVAVPVLIDARGFAEISWNKPNASAASRNTAAATATRSRLTFRCQNLSARSLPSAKSWPS